jgi:thiol-disulfide isomerase/thioredoxin/TolA-binding protein
MVFSSRRRPDLKKIRIIATLILLWSTAASADVKIGDKLTLKFTSIAGQPVDLASFKGKFVLVDFWAQWSPQSLQDAPHLVQVSAAYKDKGLQIIGVSLDDSPDTAAQAAKNLGFNWPQACDGGVWKSTYAVAWGVQTLPTAFLFGPDGALVWFGNSADIDKPLADAVKQHPAQLLSPALLAEAVAELNQIDAAIAANNAEEAIALLARFPAAALQDDRIAQHVREQQQNLQDGAAAIIASVDSLASAKQYKEAVVKLNAVIAGLAGTPAADQAKSRLNDLINDPDAKIALQKDQRERTAAGWLGDADHLQMAGDDMGAYHRFKQIVSTYPETPAATSAQQAVAVYEQDPTFLQKAKDAAAADKAKAALGLADSYRRSGRTDLAKKKYQSVIDDFPGTQFADTARQAIADLDAAAGN